jgi:predicted nucleic acid-binding protein
MIILDSNIISELIAANPDQSVSRWFKFLPRQDVYTTAITEAKMRYGAAQLDAGQRKANLESLLKQIFTVRFADRVLPFNSAAAAVFGDVVVRRERMGLRIDYPDLQIAAIALSHGATVATRNISDYEACGVELINPWTDKP